MATMIQGWTRTVVLTGVAGLGLALAACGGEGGEGPIVPPPPAPPEYADKHMPEGWWADPKIAAEGKEIYIGAKNPDVNCSSCHGKDGKPVKAGARDFRNAERMKMYSDSVWFWRISEGVPNTKMKAWKSKLSEEDRWKVLAFEASFGLSGKGWDATKNAWVDAKDVGKAAAGETATPAGDKARPTGGATAPADGK